MCSLLWAEQILRRSATTELVVEASQKVHKTVGVLSLPVVGVLHVREALMDIKTASWRTSAVNYRSELVMVPPVLMKLTSCQTMLAGHFTHQAKLVPSSFGSIKTTQVPCPEASV